MRLLVLPTIWTIVLDVVLWAAVHLFFSLWVTRRPAERFVESGALYRPRRFETATRIYEILGVHRWKAYLPDAAPWFGGRAKARLAAGDRGALSQFVTETCRGELAHWLAFLCGPLFFLWNKPWVGWLMMLYAVLGNLPCILVQRYNRFRVMRILERYH